MHKIIFEFRATPQRGATITGEATNAEILYATVVLINSLVDSMRKETEMSKVEAEELVLTMLQKALGTE